MIKKMFSILALTLLLISLGTSVMASENMVKFEDYLKVVEENNQLKQQIKEMRVESNRNFLNLFNKCIIVEEGFSYLRYPTNMSLSNLFPTSHSSGGSSTTYVTEEVYCDVLECRTNEKLVWDGFDANGCRMNQECINVPAPNPNEPHAEIYPSIK